MDKDPYRFTGMATGLLISGGLGLYFFLINHSVSEAPSAVDVIVIYLLIPPMVLFGFIFDSAALWNKLQEKVSRHLFPGFIGSGLYWAIAWPLTKFTSDMLYGVYQIGEQGQFIAPYYLGSFGVEGIFGFFLFQAMVGSGMGLVFFMAYRPMVSAIGRLRESLGIGDPDYELSIKEELGEFGFRK